MKTMWLKDFTVVLQNMVVMELCEGGSLLKVLQKDDGRRRLREFGWCAAL